MCLTEISCPECQSTNYRVHVTYQTQSGEVREEYRCLECGRYFAETTNTPLARLRTPLSKIVLVLESLNEGSGINAAARIFRACLIIRFRAHSGSTRRRTHDCLALQEKKLGKSLFNNCRL